MPKRILVTGGTGFIGHHTVEHIWKLTDWIVVVLDSLSYAGNLHRLSDILVFEEMRQAGRLEIVHHNIQAAFPSSIMAQIGHVDYIIHMAAETHVDRSIVDPYPFVMTNFVGTYNVLEFARMIPGLKKFIQVSTDEVFGPAEIGEFHDEDGIHRPSNPYAATKAGADDLAYSYFVTYGLPVVTTHTMNNFGERQNPEKFVFKALREILAGGRVEIHGSRGNPGSRCWLHARNHADGLLFLLRNGRLGEKYNIAGEELNNLQIAQIVADAVGLPLRTRFVDFHRCRPGHDKRYALSDKKMKESGWRPPFGVCDSLVKCILWTVDHPEWLKG